MCPKKITQNFIIGFVVVFLMETTTSLMAQTDPTPLIKTEILIGNTQNLIQNLEQQSGWTISYSSRLCTKEKIILSDKPQSLLQHLNVIFKDCPFSYLIRENRLILQPLSKSEKKYTISGFVREASTSESLPSANIYLPRSLTGTVSNNFGFYSISLPQGRHMLNASYVGFNTLNTDFYLKNDTIINFYLTASTELEQIDIVSDNIIERILVSKMGKIFMPVNYFRQTPALLGENDLVKNIQMLPGIQGGSEGFSGLYVRGGGPDQNLILLDDVPVYNIGHLLGFFSVFNADAVRQLTVMKGGFPARYGGRLSSVIDIKTLEGNNEKLEGIVNVGLLSSGFSVHGPLKKDKVGFALSFRRSYMDAIAALAQSGRDEKVNYYFFDLNAKLNFKLNNDNRIYLSNYWGRDKYFTTYNYSEIPQLTYNEANKTGPTSINDENNAGWGNVVTSLRWNHIFNPQLFSNLTATFSDYRFFIGVQRNYEVNYNWDTFEQRYLSGIQEISARLDIDYYPFNHHLIKTGAKAVRHEFNPGIDIIQRNIYSPQPIDTIIGDIHLRGIEFHGYVEDEFSIKERLRVNIGGRINLFKGERKFYHSFEPRIYVNYTIKPGWNINGSYSEVSQFIHLVSSSNINLPTDLWLPVTDKIPPMYSNQTSIGSEWQFSDLHNFSLSVEFYYKHLNNLLHYKESTGFFDYSSEWEDKLTSGEGWSKGIELLFKKSKGNLSGWLGYTWAKTSNKFSELNNGKPFPARFDRRHDINLNLDYKINENKNAYVLWQYGSGTPVTLPYEKYFAPDYPFVENKMNIGFSEHAVNMNDFRMPDFHRLDIGFNIQKQKTTTTRIWSFGVINAYGRQNPFLLYFDSESRLEPGTAQRKLKQLSLFPFPIPYIRYSIKF